MLAPMRAMLVLAVLVATAEARPAVGPNTQPLSCPGGAETCELDIEGTLVYSKRDKLAKWDNLRISTEQDGKRLVIYGSINIPNRTRLKLKVGTVYRFTISGRRPFGGGDLWVTNAKRL
jgi:hypothetical protein